MAEQISTPGSAADSSISKPAANPNNAPKDRSCPFCQQPFTSSSLGRHLDLYIKEKNPKPSDGVHDVDEIRKMRGAITRRQPRNSTSRRDSTPAGTPGANRGGTSGSPHTNGTPMQSPSMVTRQPMVDHKGKVKTTLNAATWHSTGVINNIPLVNQRNDLNSSEGSSDREGKRFPNRHMLAKSTFDQKQKMVEALDNARAAELALREILGSIRAAVATVQPHQSPFDFDPLALDFPTLCLTCLPPPPTINQLTPLSSVSTSWTITPPVEPQYDSLTTFFRDAFHHARVTRAMNNAKPPHPDDVLYAHHAIPSMQASLNASAQEFEDKVNTHLHASFSFWMSLPPPNRAELWKLELARAVGQKDQQITSLNEKLEASAQENQHLRQQVEYLSRCQQPREFQMRPPSTMPIGKRTAVELAEMGLRGGSVGWRLSDPDENLQTRIDSAVGRWREVVRSSRGGAMQGQRSLSGGQLQNGQPNGAGDDMDVDADGDADADADADDEHYAGAQIQEQLSQGSSRAPEAPMGAYAHNPGAVRNGGGMQMQGGNGGMQMQQGNNGGMQMQQGSHGGNAGHETANGRRQGNMVAGPNGRAGGRTYPPY
ncbi:hypothetical protein V500_04465 [Pseudogymnoascus sp. VKM F-4518 (FW-2643)]|nr:hypothetical protein V500_04465 [Pseudogymnoascus sp. VKM F-4518 (FW-2643)]